MPKIVDHDERRRELARAALTVIGRSGLEAATIRAVAEESGWSTGVLKHYYSGKDDLVRASLREMERANMERFDAAQHEPTGFDAVTTIVADIRRPNPAETRSWVAFTARATVDPKIATMMRHAIEVWIERWSELVVRGQEDGSIRRDLDTDDVAADLHALVNGIRLRDHFRPDGPSDDSTPALLRSLRPPGSVPPEW